PLVTGHTAADRDGPGTPRLTRHTATGPAHRDRPGTPEDGAEPERLGPVPATQPRPEPVHPSLLGAGGKSGLCKSAASLCVDPALLRAFFPRGHRPGLRTPASQARPAGLPTPAPPASPASRPLPPRPGPPASRPLPPPSSHLPTLASLTSRRVPP